MLTPSYPIGALVLACAIILAMPCPGQESSGAIAELQQEPKKQTWDTGGLQKRIESALERHAGKASAAAVFLSEKNEELGRIRVGGSKVMPTASLIKFPIMVEVYRQAELGEVDLDSMITLREEDKVPGSGILTEHFSAGAKLSLKDAVRLMIRYSDNTATNLVLDQIGLQSTADSMKRMGFPETQVHSKVYLRNSSFAPKRSDLYGLGSTTASDMVGIYERLLRQELLTPASCEAILEHLFTCDDNQKIARHLPVEARLAHKTGAVNRSRTDAGIIYLGDIKIVLCVLTTKNEDRSWGLDNEAEQLIAGVAKRCVLFAQEKTRPAEQQPTELANGSHGLLVEALQRTLNKRIKSWLSIDGDFGPATEAAVKSFQRKSKLEESGVVNKATWAALGTLQLNDDPVPSPEVVNREVLERAPALKLNAPPETTAKSWVIIDADNGQLLAHKEGNRTRDIASTTKLMTALLVFELAKAHPQVMEEVITFSERADQTIGSTAGVRAGERVPVSELLYGLLLPSGNDASVAIAEYFGARLSKPTETTIGKRSAAESYELFIAAMNRRAKSLGMSGTHFTNPHGLTEPGHQSTAVDLAKLALVAWAIPEFRKYVGTRQRGCRLESVNGYRRDVLWENTNRLLAQDGFWGFKTGTTSAAGACLVSIGSNESEKTTQTSIVVVLGSANSQARYVDSKNLYRWIWSR
ncbi:MAG: serine hydrolase [Planctomycetota bacterium]